MAEKQTLRPYQEAARQSIHAQWEQGRLRTLLVLPTGTGKTIVFASVAADQVRAGDRVLILAHRGELLEQAADKLQRSTGLVSSVEKAESTCLDSWYRVVVGSVQTLQRSARLERFPRDYFGTIIIDEAHHSITDGYRRILDYFDSAKVLGVTATPDRGDMRNLGEVFDSLAYEYKLTDAIKDGYLCRIMAQTIPLKLDISNVSLSGGDYAVGDLGTALDPYLEQIAAEMAQRCAGRKTVVFLPLIKTSQKFRDLLNAKGFRAAEVNGQSADRKEVLADFDAGKYNVLCNSMLLTEGWDCPSVDCVVVLRPTKVRSLYSQMVGRGTRLAEGKKDLLLLDFLWMTDKHELCRPADLVCEDRAVARQMTDDLAETGGPEDIEEAAAKASDEVVTQREEALAKQLAEQRRKKARLVDPLQYEMSIQAEDLSGYVPAFGWEAGPPTAQQTAALEKLGILPDAVESAGKAALLLDRLHKRRDEGLTTPKQIRCLEKYGFQHVGTWSFEAARHMIDRIAAGGWRSAPKGVDPKTYTPSAEPIAADDMFIW
jgi:superfamily II DNA or RNA helicase